MANGARMASIRKPATVGPMTDDPARDSSSFEFPSTSSSRSTMLGRYDW
jgi:hypothetical protein